MHTETASAGNEVCVCGVVWCGVVCVCVCVCVHACVCEREKDLRSTLQKGQSNAMLTAPLIHTHCMRTNLRQAGKQNQFNCTSLNVQLRRKSCAMYTASCTSILSIHNHFSSMHIPAKQFTLHHQSIIPKRKR